MENQIESFLQPPEVFAPDDSYYADSTREFQGIPTIERAPSGRLWAAWYGGGVTEDQSNYILLVSSENEGTNWSSPSLIIEPGRDGPVRAYDPCLWYAPDGKLWLFWSQGYEKHTDKIAGVWAITTSNPDDATPDWSTPVRLCDGVMMNKPIVTSADTWLFPVARWKTDASAQVYISSKHDMNWNLLGAASIENPADRNCDEHMIIERKNGELWMLVRTVYGIGESTSTDGGITWSSVTPSRIEHPMSRFNIRRLSNGSLLLIKHGPIGRRTERCELSAFLSIDEGESWSGGLLIDERTGVSYPDTIEDEHGVITCIYDFERHGAREILISRFSEGDIANQTSDSTNEPKLSLVNKAG